MEHLLEAIPGDDPAGPDLAYDTAVHELELAARGRPERQMGAEVLPAEPPDWADVGSRAENLLARWKDLRTAVVFSRARLERGGLAAFADTLDLMAGLLERYWSSVYPRLDPDDGDATERMNALAALAHKDGMVAALRRAPLLPPNPLGRLSLRDLDVANGRLAASPSDSGEPPTLAVVSGAAQAADADALLAERDAANRATQAVARIDALVREQLGDMAAPDLASLATALGAASDALDGWAADRGLNVAPAEHEDAATHESADETASVVQAPAAPVPAGQIDSREDVIRALDRICAYYARCEPSSPVPLLLERAKGLVAKDFLAILADLSPATLDQVAALGGPSSKNPVDDD